MSLVLISSLIIGFFSSFFYNTELSKLEKYSSGTIQIKNDLTKQNNKTAYSNQVLSYTNEEPERNIARESGEWEGMRASTFHPPCRTSANCGLAMACINNKCGGCVVDEDCGIGEGCALQHCVLDELLYCRSRTECEVDALCVLSGYSDGARGNSSMRSFCRPNSGGLDQIEDIAERERFDEARGPYQSPTVDMRKISEDLEYEGP